MRWIGGSAYLLAAIVAGLLMFAGPAGSFAGLIAAILFVNGFRGAFRPKLHAGYACFVFFGIIVLDLLLIRLTAIYLP
jgi:hypothetical protein